MRWLRQVMHVAIKDVRAAKWTVLAYLVFVAVATRIATGWPTLASPGLSAVSNILMPFGMAVAVIFVQADSPSRVDSFWATRPISTTAVVMAKVLVATLVVLLPGLVAQLIVLVWLQATPSEMAGMIGMAGAAYGIVLTIAMVVAVFTPDLKTSIIVLAFSAAALILTSMASSDAAALYVPSAFAIPLRLLPVIAFAVAIGYQYATRDTRRGRQYLAAAAVLAFGLPKLISAEHTVPPIVAKPNAVTVIGALVDTTRRPKVVGIEMLVPGTVRGDRVSMIVSEVTIEHSNGRADTVDVPRYRDVGLVEDPPMRLGKGIRWLGDQPRLTDTAQLAFVVTDSQAASLVNGDGRLHVVGGVTFSHQAAPVVLPLRASAKLGIPGARFVFDSVSTRHGLPVYVEAATLGGSSTLFGPWDTHGYALVNPSRGEALGLGVGDGSGLSSTMPLPGADEQVGQLQLISGRRMEGEPEPLDATWVSGAELHMVRWIEAGKRHVDSVVSACFGKVRGVVSTPDVRRGSGFVREVEIGVP